MAYTDFQEFRGYLMLMRDAAIMVAGAPIGANRVVRAMTRADHMRDYSMMQAYAIAFASR